jgi:hypothetical protein
MSIINDKSGSMTYNISCAKQVLSLMFPMYVIKYTDKEILFLDLNDQFTICGMINDINFLAFKEIINQMFCLQKTSSVPKYNAQGELAKKIADKFKKRNQ